MADRDDIIHFIDGYLELGRYSDYGPQGLQVEGRAQVSRVATGVSASVDLFRRAADAGADLILVHHGLFWDRESPVLKGGRRERVRLLLENDLTLASYHLCLDAHPEIGNNALAARRLGLTDAEPWSEHEGESIGFKGIWEAPKPAAAALAAVNNLYGSDSLAFLFGPPEVRSVGIVSGGAQRDIRVAIADGLDMFVTGEASEFVMHEAKEAGIHFVAAGHHNTERLGIRALGELVAERFEVDHTFIDTPNPV